MPGHKRRTCGQLPEELCSLDITEIDGFDNLHQPEGILRDLQKKAARLCGAEESFYLVNGSTAGILSAVSAAVPFGGHILMARNCHKSAYHGAYLRNLKLSYLYPERLGEFDLLEAVTAGQVRDALEKEPDIGAVLVVSPTYEGRIADTEEIARVVHARGLPLIVDEAHGAHLGLNGRVHKNSCQAGADLVIQSTHKTLPALTQTALLHVNGQLIDRELLKRFLHIYQTSSPSYPLMASIDNALCYVEENGEEAYEAFERHYKKLLTNLRRCRYLRFLPFDREKQDIGKLVISVKGTSLTGKQLYDLLLKKYHLQVEMAADSYVLAMFTLGDSPEGYARLEAALLEIDGEMAADPGVIPDKKETEPASPDDINKKENEIAVPGVIRKQEIQSMSSGVIDKKENDPADPGIILDKQETEPASPGVSGKEIPVACLRLAQAWDREKEALALEDSPGRLAGEFVNLYPPGIPLLVPGERITRELCSNLICLLQQGLPVQGIEMHEGRPLIKVLVRSD